jgi:alpha-L-fucosidase
MKPFLTLTVAALALVAQAIAQNDIPAIRTNRAERLEWFRDQGFGLFIHWSVDSQLGSVISHSLVGASEDYTKRFFEDLPKTFNPRKFHPQDWAVLAQLAGIRYVVFTAKHHSGFCMWQTATTDFNIGHTPFQRDITPELLQAFRDQGIAPGLYFSPDDFWWLHRNGITPQRGTDAVQPRSHPGLMAYDQAQVRELLTKYGPIDLMFFDGEAQGLRDLAWQLQPDIVVTRGAIQTPEQYVPGVPMEGAWEACLTMGTQWQYKPTNEEYKSGWDCLSLLIETRAKGGNLLLNIGPKPDGELPIEQEERLREIALWMFVNGECIYGVRPWIITNEKEIWFTRKKDGDALYAIVKLRPEERWQYGQWKEIVLHSVRATEQTRAGVLSQNDKVLEYSPSVVPLTTWKQEADGLHIRAMRAQRLYNDRKWPNPVVLKLTHVEPALVPPFVKTLRATWDQSAGMGRCEGVLESLGDAKEVETGFEYRDATGLDVNERTGSWVATTLTSRAAPGEFSVRLEGLQSGRTYEVRAIVKHPLLTLYGQELKLRMR